MANSVVLVTGASYGLGYALALEAAQSGAHVLALGRTQGALDDLADEIDKTSGAVTLVPMDITDDGAIEYLSKSIAERWGKIDKWLHTAWFTAPMQPVAHLITKDLDKAWNTNIRATAKLIAGLEPLLRATDGKAVFFDQDDLEKPFAANIRASKSAQMDIVKTWKSECQQLGPQVEIMTPAPFFSNVSSTLYPGKTRDDYSTAAIEAQKIWGAISKA